MRRVMYLYLPTWPIDRLRRLGSVPSLCVAAPADEQPFATVAGVRMSRHRMFFTSAKAQRELRFRARPYLHGLEDAIRWFRDAGYLRR